MDYRMKDFGAVLESRDLAKSLCQTIVDEHWRRPNEHKRLDFAGVRVVSNFFADEFIGGLVNGMGTDTFRAGFTLLNLSSINKIWIDRALDRHKDAPAKVAPPDLPPLPKPAPSKVEGPEPPAEPPKRVPSKVEPPAPKLAPARMEEPAPRVEPTQKPEPKKQKPAPKPKPVPSKAEGPAPSRAAAPAAKKAAPAKKPAKGKKK